MSTVTLTEEVITDTIIEGDTGRIFLKTRTLLKDGDVIVAERIHRRPIEPDADVTKESAEVQAIAAVVRTPERLAAFDAIKEADAL